MMENIIPLKLPPIRQLFIDSSGKETKGHLDGGPDRMFFENRLREIFPSATDEQIDQGVDSYIERYYGSIDSQKRNPKTYAHIDVPLPKGTDWGDLRIHVISVRINQNSKEIEDCHIEIFIRDDQGIDRLFKVTNFHELHLEDSVRKIISISGYILLLMAIGKSFSWLTKNIPNNYRVAKNRLTNSLQKHFSLRSDPLYRVKPGNKYGSHIRLTANARVIEECSYITSDFILKSSYETV